MDELGYTVFAAVKKLDDDVREQFEDMFGPNSNARLLQCDVIKYRDVTETAKLVRKVLGQQRQLWAVISTGSFTGRCAMNANFDEVLKVAALGSARITKAFLPLLRMAKKSRVIFVTSPSVANDSTVPLHVSYAFSRAAETR